MNEKNTTAKNTPAGTVKRVEPQGEGGYLQCWYPVARAEDVKTGEVIGADYLDGRIAVFRGENGRVEVMSAYCRHIGADLSVGAVVGNELRCAYHFWKFGQDGKCCSIPSGAPIPEEACLFHFPTVESCGLIWAFNGTEPLYDAPDLPEGETPLAIDVSEPWEQPLDNWILHTNGFDFEHLKYVHNLELISVPEDVEFDEFGTEFDVEFVHPKAGPIKFNYRLIGANVFYLVGEVGGAPLQSFVGTLPVAGGRTRGWNVAATPVGADTDEERARVQGFLNMGQQFMFGLIAEDDPITQTMRFREDIFVKADTAMLSYFDYLRRFPRAHPSQEFIT